MGSKSHQDLDSFLTAPGDPRIDFWTALATMHIKKKKQHHTVVVTFFEYYRSVGDL